MGIIMVKEDSIAVEKRGLAERHILISENSFTGLCKAAREGNVQAQYKLGKCYYFGIGVAINYKEAAKWYHKAAMQKNIMAQYSLSLCYQCGHGVKKDSTEAFKWGQMAHAGFQKAAEIGNIWAQIHLCFFTVSAIKLTKCINKVFFIRRICFHLNIFKYNFNFIFSILLIFCN